MCTVNQPETRTKCGLQPSEEADTAAASPDYFVVYLGNAKIGARLH
jgi:hypothetical protein